jgi:hypothetical protein
MAVLEVDLRRNRCESGVSIFRRSCNQASGARMSDFQWLTLVAPLWAIAYRLWARGYAKRDYFIVEWRTLNPEGKDAFPDWNSSSMNDAVLRLRGLSAALKGKVVQVTNGNDELVNRSLSTFTDFGAAHHHFVTTSKYTPGPHFAACAAFLWMVSATNHKNAVLTLSKGGGFRLERSPALFG